jgi:broad specificity phosphatase PhoE
MPHQQKARDFWITQKSSLLFYLNVYLDEGECRMKVYLVRHGETDWNKDGRIQGRKEVDLNLFGLKQAHLCGKRLKNIPFDCAYSSPQSRAYQTAELIVNHHDIGLRGHKSLEEIDLGSWEGLTWSQVKRQHKGIVDDFSKDRQTAKLHGGESYEAVTRRAMDFLNGLERLHYQHVLVVSHAGVLKMMLSDILGLPHHKRSNFHISNTGISIIEKESTTSRWRVLTLNDTAHLEEFLYE